MRILSALIFALALLVTAPAARAEQSAWDNIERIVVIGDLEGDYEKFVDMLRQAQLIDADGDWAGGQTHLVQLGDIPDRGPNSRMIMDHLMRLEPQALRADGHVHALIGNHEAMNVEGDLRYVHPGEYAAFADRRSARRRTAFYRQTQAHLRQNPPPSGVPVFDDAFRAQWESEHPLGYVEHRQAWAPTGAYGRWIATHESVIRINDLLFLHAGIGPAYLPAERDAMNEAVRDALSGQPDPAFADILTAQQGPLWYRGLSLNDEAQETPHLDALLGRHGVSRIIVGHTKRAATVLPRFDGRVIITDIAQRPNSPDPHAFLIIENGALTTVHRGQRVPLIAATHAQTCEYLARIVAIDGSSSPVQPTLAACRSGAESQAATTAP
ncbi:MAG: metallophosphoesterase [Caulobacterales bacterium]|nr:metallophosphoesterase [Caulobacterales bacterium]